MAIGIEDIARPPTSALSVSSTKKGLPSVSVYRVPKNSVRTKRGRSKIEPIKQRYFIAGQPRKGQLDRDLFALERGERYGKPR